MALRLGLTLRCIATSFELNSVVRKSVGSNPTLFIVFLKSGYWGGWLSFLVDRYEAFMARACESSRQL